MTHTYRNESRCYVAYLISRFFPIMFYCEAVVVLVQSYFIWILKNTDYFVWLVRCRVCADRFFCSQYAYQKWSSSERFSECAVAGSRRKPNWHRAGVQKPTTYMDWFDRTNEISGPGAREDHAHRAWKVFTCFVNKFQRWLPRSESTFSSTFIIITISSMINIFIEQNDVERCHFILYVW